ncbi:MAG TPA: hypothetical protein VE972_00465 [Conexibacter sp.]|nr:hypothetical protein [Conexibacter sp.]
MLTAAAVLAVGTSTSMALRSIGVSEINLRGRSRALTFRGTEERSFRVVCEVTGTLTMARAITKVEGTRVGSTTNLEIPVSSCRAEGGSVTEFTALRLPWSDVYVSFLGTLPEITGFKGRETIAFLLGIRSIVGQISCLYEGTVFALVTVSRREISTGRIIGEETGMPLISGSPFCPRRGTVEGTGETSPSVRITLL